MKRIDRTIAAGLIGLWVALAAGPVAAEAIAQGDRAPFFETKYLRGDSFVLKEHLGKNLVLLNFWSVFCRDCLSRLEALNKMADLYQRRNLEIVGVCGDPPTDRMIVQVQKYAAKMHFRVILDPDLAIFTSYGVESIPFAVLIDQNGMVLMAVNSLEPEPLKHLSDTIAQATKEQ